MEYYAEEKLRKTLSQIGYFLAYEERSSSTIRSALAMEDGNFPAAVIADHQTKGIGRYGHAWHDRKGASILITLVENSSFLKKLPPNLLAHLFLLSCCSSLCKTIKCLDIRIKWPNDLVVGEKKLGGIILDCASRKNACLISLGLNVSANPMKDSASLQDISSQKLDRVDLLSAILSSWKKDRRLFEKKCHEKNLTGYEKRWMERSALLGKNIHLLRADGKEISGRVKDTSFGGGLTVEQNNHISKINLGDYLPGSLISIDK